MHVSQNVTMDAPSVVIMQRSNGPGFLVRAIWFLFIGWWLSALAIGVACLGVVGPVLVPWSYVNPDVGTVFTLTAFVTVVLGGMGSVSGAFFGGLILGVVTSVSQMFMQGTYGLIPQYLVFILLLLFRPAGLFSRRI